MVGEKYETKILRGQLARFFEKRDYEGAKNCFLAAYQKRPDVLMEASDVTGELRLCMQIISTCSFEDALYKRCILDAIRDYKGLIAHFHKLNTTVCRFLANAPAKEDLLFLGENKNITPTAVEISVRLFCKDVSKQEEMTQKICSYLPS